MNFVRENIQEADLVAFDLEGEDARQPAKTSSRRWVIDRSAGVSLRLISWFTGPGYSSKKRIWSLRVSLETVEVETETVLEDLTTAPAQVVYRLKSLKLPSALKGREDELIRYMKEALVAYGLGGRPDQTDRATNQLLTDDIGAP